MATSPNLGIQHVAANQANKEVTINDGLTNLDKALTEAVITDIATADHAFTDAEVQRNIVVGVTNVGATKRTVTLPALKRLYIFKNADATNVVAIQVGTTAMDVAADTMVMIYTDGTANGLFAVASGSGGGGSSTFLALTDTPASFTGMGGKLVAVNAGATALEFVDASGATMSILGLTDTPASYGTTGQVLVVNGTTDGMEFADQSGGGASLFKDLTDTPAAYGTGLYLVRMNAAGDALEYVDPSVVGATAGTTYSEPFRGAVLPPVAQLTQNISAFAEITAWGAATLDTDSFYNGTNPGRLTIPAGITKVRAKARMSISLATAGQYLAAKIIHTRGAVTTEVAWAINDIGATDHSIELDTPVMDVQEGDYFHVEARTEADTSVTINAKWGEFFQLEVIETTSAGGRPYDLSCFVAGQPTASALVFQHVCARPMTFKKAADNISKAFAKTASSTSRSFTLKRNGVSFGTILFMTSTDGVVSASSDRTFAVGDRFEIVAPSTQDSSMADISFTLVMELT